MGEVYRADDLKLGQPVALKFLPEGLERDEARLSRFMNEVRIARQVAHPNVCRVYDVGEIDGHHFISMEYVDGEDLGSLLRRIGRLPADKGGEIARQISAGLAAAHDAGVLHRDLKPANIMIDGRGRARITDFGLASLGGVVAGDEARVGTPAYMSPEQLAGNEVTFRSDVYALGLLLYEMFTGKPPFKAANTAELRELQTSGPPTSPSSMVGGLDPAVERVILRCLDPDPARRPSSALAVMAALPGGDPLAAAIAAGETPSPELVAAAGEAGGLSPRIAGWATAAILAGLVLIVFLAGDTQLVRVVPMEKPPEVLAARAREILGDLGYTEQPVDSISAFEADSARFAQLQRAAEERGLRAAPGIAQPASAILFRYRQSPRYLERGGVGIIGNWFTDPPATLPGMVELSLDLDGRLRYLVVVPSDQLPSPGARLEPEWTPLLAAAGLDPKALTPVEPRHVPPVFADRQAAWSGRDPGDSDRPLLAEAAALGGRPVAFRLSIPSDSGEDPAAETAPAAFSLVNLARGVAYLSVLTVALFLALHNLRRARGDVKGALRFAAYLGSIRLLWILGAHHTPTDQEFSLVIGHLAWAMYRVGIVALMYLAIEPYARRLWPRMLISWTRLLHGGLRDSMVGCDALAGIALGVLGALSTHLFAWLPSRLGLESPPPLYRFMTLESLRGMRHAVSALLGTHTDTTLEIFIPLTLFLFLKLFTGRAWIAVGVVSLLGIAIYYPGTGSIPLYVTTIGCFMVLFWLSLFRFGFLSVIVAASVAEILRVMPLTFDLSAPYSGVSILTLAAVAGLTLVAFRISLAGRTLFRDALLDSERAA